MRTDEGWVSEIDSQEMPDASVREVRKSLSGRKGIDQAALEKFIARLQSAWRHSFKKPAIFDRGLTHERFGRVASTAREVAAAISNLDRNEREQLDGLDAFEEALSRLQESADTMVMEFSRSRGEYERFDESARMFVHMAASAWHQCFDAPASYRPDGLFPGAVNGALEAAGRDPLGRDAFRSILHPVGK